MIGSNKFRDLVSYIPGLLTLSLGIYLAIKQPQVTYVTNQILGSVELIDGKYGYDIWKDVDIFFRVWLFHVTNPDEVMQGGFPVLEERGPYVYNLNLKKHVISVDEDADEMAFTTYRTYRFNETESGSLSDDEEVVILNAAYCGTALMLAEKFPMFLDKFGNSLYKLFPNAEDIFTRAKVKDILFNGLPLVCDSAANKELALICTGLRGKKPPIIKNTDKPDHYIYSLFDAVNMTDQGPFTVNRGIKNKDALGNTTSYKGRRILKYWSEQKCNVVQGTDSITWPPLEKKLPFLWAFEPNMCRLTPRFKREDIIHGLVGYRYAVDKTVWSKESMACYCPINKKKEPECLPTGVFDATKCQEAPTIFSEPHFLHGDPSLLEFAQGLYPNYDRHGSFIIIEPTSGAPLRGSKKVQLNMKMKPIPAIALLSNISAGYFPILWAEEANTATVEQLSSLIMAFRLIRVLKYFPWLIIVLGIFFTGKIWWIRGGNDNQIIVETPTIQTQRGTIHPVQQRIYRRPDNRREQAFT